MTPFSGPGGHLARVAGQLRQADGAALLSILMWGLNIPLSKVSLGEIDILKFIGARNCLGAAVSLTALVVIERDVKLRSADRVPVVLLGLFGFGLTQFLFFAGLQFTLASHASLLQGLNPVFAAILAGWTGSGRLKPTGWIGVAVCLAGLLLITGADGEALDQRVLLGNTLVLLGGATGAAYTVFSRRFLLTYSPLKIQTYGFTSTALVWSVAASGPWLRHDWAAVYWPAYAALAYTGVSGFLAGLFWLYSIRRIGPVRTALYQYLIPVVGLVFSMVLLQDRLDARQSIGAGVLLAGLVLALYSKQTSSAGVPAAGKTKIRDATPCGPSDRSRPTTNCPEGDE